MTMIAHINNLFVEIKGVFMNNKMKKFCTVLWLSFICAFVLIFPANVFAGNGDNDANADAVKGNIELTKEVKQDGKQKPGKEKFMFEMVPAEGHKDLTTAGITVDTNTVETNGVGKFEGTLNFSVDKSKINENNGWKAFGKNKNNYLISYTLQEKNDGKKGWEYGTKKYDVVISYYSDDNTLYTSTYLPGTDAMEHAEFMNTFKGVEIPTPQDPAKKPEVKENVKTGNSNEMTMWISLAVLGVGTLALAIRFRKNA